MNKSFGVSDVLQCIDDRALGDSLEVIALAAGMNRLGNLVWFSRRKDEQYMRWRFFQGLEQRVEGAGREHVDLIDDVGFSSTPGRHEFNGLSDFPDLLHAIVACTINFEDVDRAPARYFFARGAYTAGLVVGPSSQFSAFERMRAGCLSDASASGEQKRMSNSVQLDRILQGLGDVRLANHLIKVVGRHFLAGRDMTCGPKRSARAVQCHKVDDRSLTPRRGRYRCCLRPWRVHGLRSSGGHHKSRQSYRLVAERVGFEPTVRVNTHASKRAP